MANLHLLIYGHAFPNQAEPGRGIFVKQLLAMMPAEIDYRVVAPVPWFLSYRRGKKQTHIPYQEEMQIGNRTIQVYRPRFLLLPANLLRPWIGWLEYLTTILTVRRLQRDWKIDLIHVNFAYPDGIACRQVSKVLGIPYIITEHMGAIAKLLTHKSLKRQLIDVYTSARKTVIVSQTVGNAILSETKQAVEIIHIPNGLDLSLYHCKGKTTKLQNLIYVGNLIETKGIHILLHALTQAAIRDYNLKLTIVGEGKYLPVLQKLVLDLGLQSSVNFAGWKSPEAIADLLSMNDLLVLPSFKESFGIVLIEAMASGLPVLSTTCGGPSEIVTPESGYLVEPNNVSALAVGLDYMISHYHEFQPEEIQRYCRANFDSRILIKKLTDLYSQNIKPIRVCHFTSVHVRTDVRVLVKQCQGLSYAGYKVHLVVADGKGDQTWQGVCIHDIGSSSNRFARMVIKPLLLLQKIISLQCEIYHFHDPELLPVALLLKKLTKAKVIYDVHEDYYGAFLHKPYLPPYARPILAHLVRGLEKYVGCRLDQMITATDHIRGLLQGINPQTDTINNYPKLSEWVGLGTTAVNKTARTICYIGNITEVRGLTSLIQALEHVDCELLLAGAYEPKSYRDVLVKLTGWKKVKEFGYVNRQKAAEIIVQSMVGIVLFLPEPNHINALSTKLFEYMAGGIAVLASDFPMWETLIAETGCGLCVDPQSSAKITEALNFLLDNPEKAREMGHQGSKMTHEKFNWENEEAKLLKIYKRLSE